MTDRMWRIIFLTAAVFNFLVGLLQMIDLVALTGSAPPLPSVAYHSFYSPLLGAFIVLFGILYFIVSRDLSQRGIVLVGALGKAFVVAFVIYAGLAGIAPMEMANLVAIDAIYVALFVWFLVSPRAGAGS